MEPKTNWLVRLKNKGEVHQVLPFEGAKIEDAIIAARKEHPAAEIFSVVHQTTKRKEGV